MLIGALGAVFALTLVRRLGWAPFPTFAVSAGLGAAFAAAYARAEVLRSICSVLGLAPVLFGFLFLFTSNASSLVTSGDARVWDARGTSSPPIVVVSFDAFPVQMLMDEDSRIDAGRFPNFARFARDATWYPNATNVHENTVFSVPSILDGKVPEPGQEPTVQDHPENLFTLLGHTYEMRVSEEATNLCPARLCERPNDPGGTARLTQLADDASVVYEYLVAPDALRERLPPSTTAGATSASPAGAGQGPRNKVIARLVGGERPQRFRGSVAAMRAGKRPTLDFMHMLLPHEPLEYLPTGQRYQAGSKRDPSLDGPPSYDNAFLTDQAFQRHLLQVGFVDRLLGEMIGAVAPRRPLGPRAGGADGRPRHGVPRQADARAAVRPGPARLPPRADAGERGGHRHGPAVREVPRAGGGPDRPAVGADDRRAAHDRRRAGHPAAVPRRRPLAAPAAAGARPRWSSAAATAPGSTSTARRSSETRRSRWPTRSRCSGRPRGTVPTASGLIPS